MAVYVLDEILNNFVWWFAMDFYRLDMGVAMFIGVGLVCLIKGIGWWAWSEQFTQRIKWKFYIWSILEWNLGKNVDYSV